MTRKCSRLWIALASFAAFAPIGLAADAPNYTRTEDVVYGRKFGTALTLDVFTPQGKGQRGRPSSW